ncbi:MAG: hypothetical protein ACQCN4_04785 [Candidatus Bathyarchaeia archaeon]|jgi:hypothetical protein
MSTNDKPIVVFGTIRYVGWDRYPEYEGLCFAKNRLVVARQKKDTAETYLPLKDISVEELLKADKNNFAIPYEDVEQVELKKSLRTIKLTVKTSKDKYTWSVKYMPHNEFLALDDVKRVLKPIFDWKLDVPSEEF